MQVLDLFGGIKVLLERMNALALIAVRKLMSGDIAPAERVLGLESGTVRDIAEGRRPVDWELFQTLSCILNLTPADLLGEPAFENDAEEQKWRQRWSTDATVIAACGAGDPMKAKVSFHMFLHLRAMSDLSNVPTALA